MKAHKVKEIRQYTEVVYYDDDGHEVGRVAVSDDDLYDTEPPEVLTSDEREDWL